MNFLAFTVYLSKAKRGFIRNRYDRDCHYRCVLFHQFAESYRWYCRTHGMFDEYDRLYYEVLQYEKRLSQYRERLE